MCVPICLYMAPYQDYNRHHISLNYASHSHIYYRLSHIECGGEANRNRCEIYVMEFDWLNASVFTRTGSCLISNSIRHHQIMIEPNNQFKINFLLKWNQKFNINKVQKYTWRRRFPWQKWVSQKKFSLLIDYLFSNEWQIIREFIYFLCVDYTYSKERINTYRLFYFMFFLPVYCFCIINKVLIATLMSNFCETICHNYVSF